MPKYSELERIVREKFLSGKKFKFLKTEYEVVTSGKPSPSRSGECKTDLYILALKSNGDSIELKFSIKKDDYEFVENKIKKETAIDIFGSSAAEIISELAFPLKEKFEEQTSWLDSSGSYKRIILGWKIELFKETGRKLSSELTLSKKKLKEILSGENRTQEKRNCLVNGKVIPNSGVANWMMVLPDDLKMLEEQNVQYFISKIESIDDHLDSITINAGFTALSFFPGKEFRGEMGKWDTNRPLAIWIDWRKSNGVLEPKIILNECFKYSGDELGEKMKTILKL